MEIVYVEDIDIGGNGVVRKAIYNGSEVAVKVIKIKDDRHKSLINTEATMMRLVTSDFVIRLIDVRFHEGEASLVMDLASSNLLQLIRDLTPEQCWTFGLQVVQAVRYCHERNVMHLDIKPSNVLIHDNKAKLCDFGFAAKTDSRSLRSSNVTTCWYRPIELLLGEQSFGTEVDIWSLGCLLYELSTGQVLFRPRKTNMKDMDKGAFLTNQARCVFETLGRSVREWKGMSMLKYGVAVQSEWCEGDSSFYCKYRDANPRIPEWGDLICAMVDPDPKRRPSIQSVHDAMSAMSSKMV
jgi:serine/threonine protein kinase